MSKTPRLRRNLAVLPLVFALASLPVYGQDGQANGPRGQYGPQQNQQYGSRGAQQYNNRDERGVRQNARVPQGYYSGMSDAGRGGDYGGKYSGYNNGDGYNNGGRYHQPGGIGPGKGALIGGAGGAILGALFGGGLQGAVIGGAGGAGVGAIVGAVNQDHRRNEY